MGDRNSRIVRNRERSSNRFDINNIKTMASIFTVIFIIVLIIIVICFKVKGRKNIIDTAELDTNTTYEYFLLSSGDNLGVIDKFGNKIIDTKYVRIDIPNLEKDVFICYTSDGKCDALNKNGEKILANYKEIETIEPSDENGEAEKNALKYKNNGLYGLIDLDGNVITEAIYDEISSLNCKPGNILVKKEDKYGILDAKGNVLIDVKYDSVVADEYCSPQDSYEKTGYIISEKNDNGMNFGYIDYKGNLILDVKYESLERALVYDKDDIYLIAMQNGKKGVFKNKKKIIDLNFQSIVYSNVFIVNKNGKYGFYTKDGKEILKPQYTDFAVAGNYISVEEDGDTKLYDMNGNLVNTNKYTKMSATENPEYFIAEDENGFYSIINRNITIEKKYTQVEYAFDDYFIFTNEDGKAGVINVLTDEIKINPEYDFIILIEGTKVLQAIDGTKNLVDIYSKDLEKTLTMEDGVIETLENGYSIVYSDIDMKYINSEGYIVKNTEVYPNKNLYSIQQDGKWGFKNLSEEIIVHCEYDIVTEFNEYGFAGIKKDGKWGVIKENGEILVEPKYELDTYYFPQFVGKYILVQSEYVYCEEVESDV